MKWTKEKPNISGLWWMKETKEAIADIIYVLNPEIVDGNCFYNRFYFFGGQDANLLDYPNAIFRYQPVPELNDQ